MTDPIPLRLLAVDDDPSEHVLLERHAARVAGFELEVVRCHDVETALLQLGAGHFDLVLLDHHLGPIDGLELLQRMRDRRLDVPTVLLTGRSDERLRSEAREAGAVDHVTKTELSSDSLGRIVQRLVEARAGRS